jgi:hypothetical protein
VDLRGVRGRGDHFGSSRRRRGRVERTFVSSIPAPVAQEAVGAQRPRVPLYQQRHAPEAAPFQRRGLPRQPSGTDRVHQVVGPLPLDDDVEDKLFAKFFFFLDSGFVPVSVPCPCSCFGPRQPQRVPGRELPLLDPGARRGERGERGVSPRRGRIARTPAPAFVLLPGVEDQHEVEGVGEGAGPGGQRGAADGVFAREEVEVVVVVVVLVLVLVGRGVLSSSSSSSSSSSARLLWRRRRERREHPEGGAGRASGGVCMGGRRWRWRRSDGGSRLLLSPLVSSSLSSSAAAAAAPPRPPLLLPLLLLRRRRFLFLPPRPHQRGQTQPLPQRPLLELELDLGLTGAAVLLRLSLLAGERGSSGARVSAASATAAVVGEQDDRRRAPAAAAVAQPPSSPSD